MARERTGSIIKRDGKIYARLTYTDSAGKRHDLTRRAIDRKDAKRIIKEILAGLESKGEQAVEASRATFNDLAERYSAVKVKPAEYREDRKIAGMRDHVTAAGHVRTLVEHFGSMKLRDITAGKIEQFKQARLATPKMRGGKERSIANVNRTLTRLRAMLRFAVAEGWIDISPSERASSPIISKADEMKRTRVLSREEEARLLEVCGPDTPRAHIAPLIVAALDTGCRRGELLSMTWLNVDFTNRQISICAMTTKTLTSRVVPVSTRLIAALQGLHNSRKNDGLVFGMVGDFKRSWRTACKLAGITDLHFHDLRATFATRLLSGGMQLAEVAKITGHTQLSTLYAHYIRNTSSAVERAGRLLDSINCHPAP
jgi:integrase